jgi:hypothetical protein
LEEQEGIMPQNVGLVDRIVRFVLFLGFAVFGLLNMGTGLWWIGLFGLIFLVTGLAGYCPIWHLTGIKTVSVKKL